MEDGPISFDHDITIVPVLEIEEILGNAEATEGLGKSLPDP